MIVVRRIALAVALLLTVAGCGGGGDDTSAVPDLAIRSLTDDGSSGSSGASLADLRDQPMVLNLWAPWCPPCRTEMPDFDTVSKEFPGVRFVGLATGTEEAAAVDFAEKVGVSYGLYYDVDDAAFDAFSVTDLPATFVIDADGTIVETHRGVLSADELRTLVGKLTVSG